MKQLCQCWNPELEWDKDESTGEAVQYCDKCGQVFEGREPREDVLDILESVRGNVGKPILSDEILGIYLDLVIEKVKQTK